MSAIRFGTDNVEDMTDKDDPVVTVVRVYENKTCHHFCNHRHKSRKASAKCARELASGVTAGGGESKVIICTPAHALRYKDEYRKAMDDLRKGRKSKVKKTDQELLMEAFRYHALESIRKSRR